jgi:hypothetical protein
MDASIAPGTTGTDRPDPRTAAASAVSPDAVTAKLLERHEAGDKLNPQEYGKIGAFAAKRNKLFSWLNPAKERGVTGSPQPGASPGNPTGLAPVAPGQASADSLAPVEIDDDLARRTFQALLEHGDEFFVRFIEREARAAGATGETLNRFRSSAALSSNDKKLLISLAPDICRDLGINPRRLALYTAIGVLGLHSVNLWQCTQELRELRKATAPAPAPAATSAPTLLDGTKNVDFPNPTAPAGAPPTIK